MIPAPTFVHFCAALLLRRSRPPSHSPHHTCNSTMRSGGKHKEGASQGAGAKVRHPPPPSPRNPTSTAGGERQCSAHAWSGRCWPLCPGLAAAGYPSPWGLGQKTPGLILHAVGVVVAVVSAPPATLRRRRWPSSHMGADRLTKCRPLSAGCPVDPRHRQDGRDPAPCAHPRPPPAVPSF